MLDNPYTLCNKSLKNKHLQNVLDTGENFDLLITDALGSNQLCLLSIGYKLKVPTVNINIGPLQMGVYYAQGANPDPWARQYLEEDWPWYIIGSWCKFYYDLFDSGWNFYYDRISSGYDFYKHIQEHDKVILSHFNDTSIPSTSMLAANISLTIANYHPAYGIEQMLPPNIVPIPGIQISKVLPPVPKVGLMMK